MIRFNYYVEGRAFEWVLALSMLFLSAETRPAVRSLKGFPAAGLFLFWLSVSSAGTRRSAQTTYGKSR